MVVPFEASEQGMHMTVVPSEEGMRTTVVPLCLTAAPGIWSPAFLHVEAGLFSRLCLAAVGPVGPVSVARNLDWMVVHNLHHMAFEIRRLRGLRKHFGSSSFRSFQLVASAPRSSVVSALTLYLGPARSCPGAVVHSCPGPVACNCLGPVAHSCPGAVPHSCPWAVVVHSCPGAVVHSCPGVAVHNCPGAVVHSCPGALVHNCPGPSQQAVEST
mmetsp:Transcript_27133/g.49393  ORF Transcript_27133/g.49393 Transcript_27133/m.49393 type:complete len:214 (-) Transcript_27133:501-1142(-)